MFSRCSPACVLVDTYPVALFFRSPAGIWVSFHPTDGRYCLTNDMAQLVSVLYRNILIIQRKNGITSSDDDIVPGHWNVSWWNPARIILHFEQYFTFGCIEAYVRKSKHEWNTMSGSCFAIIHRCWWSIKMGHDKDINLNKGLLYQCFTGLKFQIIEKEANYVIFHTSI